LVLDFGRTHFLTDKVETFDGLVTDDGFFAAAKVSEENDKFALELGQQKI